MSEANVAVVIVTDLEVGMYVSRLDRPWLETPFVVQGFYIADEKEIEELEKHCKFVYVDMDRSHRTDGRRDSRTVAERVGQRPLPQQAREQGGSLQFAPRTENVGAMLFPHRRIHKYQDEHGLEQELGQAKSVFADLTTSMQDLMIAYELGGTLDVSVLRDTVKPMVDSVVRNPDACIWLARLKNEDTYTYGHSVGCSIWAVALGRQLGIPKIDLNKLATGALLFDIGKLKLPKELMQKSGKLSDAEFELVRSHVKFGEEMLQEAGIKIRPTLDMLMYHHERHAGHGYPHGLSGDEIPVFARIAALVDCYDAITSVRPYGKPMSPSFAVKKLYAWRDVDFQAELVEEFIQAIGLYPAGTLVELSSGEVAVVLAEYRTRRLRPQLLLILDKDKKRLKEMRKLDLGDATEGPDGKPLEIVTSLEPGAYDVRPEEIYL